jgi:hypothetical protein
MKEKEKKGKKKNKKKREKIQLKKIYIKEAKLSIFFFSHCWLIIWSIVSILLTQTYLFVFVILFKTHVQPL